MSLRIYSRGPEPKRWFLTVSNDNGSVTHEFRSRADMRLFTMHMSQDGGLGQLQPLLANGTTFTVAIPDADAFIAQCFGATTEIIWEGSIFQATGANKIADQLQAAGTALSNLAFQ